MDVNMAVENTVDDALTERFVLFDDTNAVLLRELSQHSMFTEALPDRPPLNIVMLGLWEYIDIMVCTLERLNVGEDAVKAQKLWNSRTHILRDCDSKLNVRGNPECSRIFMFKSRLKPLKGYELDKAVAFKVTPLLNFIETSISEYSKSKIQNTKNEYSNLDNLFTILHTHLDGMTLRLWYTSWLYTTQIWRSMIVAHLEDCVEVIQHNNISEQYTDSKVGTFIADGRVIEELPVSIEAQKLLGAACEWWCSKLSEWTKPYDPHAKLPELHRKRNELSLLKLTEVYCAVQEYNEEWAFSLLV